MRAFITGASSGIGAEFARKLAVRKYDLCRVARKKEKLDELSKELVRKYHINVKIIVADLCNKCDVSKLKKFLLDNEIDLLINNAGFGLGSQFIHTSSKRNVDMINVHITASVVFSHAVLRNMLKNKGGKIINVASIAAWLPLTQNVLYRSTKMFLVSFTKALNAEVKSRGITVQVLCPGLTHTGFHSTDAYHGFDKSKLPAWLWMNPAKVVECSLRDLGRGKLVCIPGLKNKIIVFIGKQKIILDKFSNLNLRGYFYKNFY